ncbi:hypothetical protein [Parvibaculum sp.]|uniref:hypothetical protein n=1 Tax=Parvibaculum sp. TaxID=2024848 RepID=UPI003BABB71A
MARLVRAPRLSQNQHVIAGLDPAIQKPRSGVNLRKALLAAPARFFALDARVRPGHDR